MSIQHTRPLNQRAPVRTPPLASRTVRLATAAVLASAFTACRSAGDRLVPESTKAILMRTDGPVKKESVFAVALRDLERAKTEHPHFTFIPKGLRDDTDAAVFPIVVSIAVSVALLFL